MELTHLIAFNLTLLAALAAPGPAFLYATKQAVSGGFLTGIAGGVGLGLVASAWTAAALLGLDVLFLMFPLLYTGLKIAGALYLFYLAYTLWRDAKTSLREVAYPRANAFLGGLLVNLANPKSVLFAASVLIVIFPEGLSLPHKAFIVINHFCVELFVYALVSAVLASPLARAGYLRLKPAFDRGAAIVLGAVGLRLLFTR